LRLRRPLPGADICADQPLRVDRKWWPLQASQSGRLAVGLRPVADVEPVNL